MKQLWKRLGYMTLTVCILVQLYVFVRIHWITLCIIPTYSMSPTLQSGDYIVASLQIPGRRIVEEDEGRGDRKIHRLKGFRTVQRNDVVVFNYPYSDGKEKMVLNSRIYFCKRCVAVPGDTYQWQTDGVIEQVYLPKAGDVLPIDSLNYERYCSCIEYETGDSLKLEKGLVYLADTLLSEYHFQHGYYFMRGDNANHSYDSRNWGLLPDDFILGVGKMIWFSRDLETGKIRWNRIFRKI